MNELQNRWINGQLIGLDIIFDCSNSIIPIEIKSIKNKNITQSFGREYFISYGEAVALSEFIKYNDDPWSEIQINDKIHLDDFYIYCGEGEMGNEGFIVKTDANDNLIWMLYSTTSNPFYKIKQKNNMMYIQSTHNFHVALNVTTNDIYICNEII